ncbi:MAG: EamA family transporter [Acidobacteria bacterium]|nr:EamA family transporter [Acidobacteriota bacterium]
MSVSPEKSHKNRVKGNTMVVACTILGATAQMLIKRGTTMMPPLLDPSGGSPIAQAPLIAWKILTNLPLFGGLACYGLSTLLLVLALRYGELSVLYPIIALTYVWVTILSVFLLGESVNAFKLAGLVFIVLGVAVLGRKEKDA